MKRVCIFCGSASGAREAYVEAARELGHGLAARGMELVYGGGKVGLMGAVADATLEAGGKVIGIIPKALMDKEIGHKGLTELRVVGSMHERKAMMADLAESFIAMPGGFGTFDEFFEILTWAQLGMHRKPCAVLNTAHYFDPLIALFDQAVNEGFVREIYRNMIVIGEEPGALLDVVKDYQPPLVDKWIDRKNV